MKVIAWNCRQGGFQNKMNAVLNHKPDILVIPECEPQKLTFPEEYQPTGEDWIGDDFNPIGLGVFCFNGYRLKRLDGHDPAIKYIAPFQVFKDETSLILLPIWTWYSKDTKVSGDYIDIFRNAVDRYKRHLSGEKVLFLGDFNSPGTGNNLSPGTEDNLDNQARENPFLTRHKEIVKSLSDIGVQSLYHYRKHEEKHGEEKTATYYHRFHSSEPFHCDYCFASKDMVERLIDQVIVGDLKDWEGNWKEHSDHMPLIMTFRDR